MLIGCIADDFTGASDLANTLAKQGMSVTQFVGVSGTPASPDCEAGVVALKSRSIPASEAKALSLEALEWLKDQGCQQFLFKYCSTFDSTPEGNIGPVAEALLNALDAPFAIVCPAFPTVGRTVYQGHLFVNDHPLSESGMENHPLNPMTDSDLRRWLRRQSTKEVGFVGHSIVRQGSEVVLTAMQKEASAGKSLIVVDAIDDADLLTIGRALAGHRLVTGGSGIALGLPENFRARGLLAAERKKQFSPTIGPGAALSGSCSPTSQKQLEHHLLTSPGLRVESADLISGKLDPLTAANWVIEHIDHIPIVYSTADAQTVGDTQQRFGRAAMAHKIEDFFSTLATFLVARGVVRLAVGGGETSGAVVQGLRANKLIIGPEVDPGVPALEVETTPVRLALKSGNFGSLDFYQKALRVLGEPA
ncbi:3-oxo-tetronate kinase [Rhizobium sp. CF142]|uniref:3-oxo-tetronate kinase n=1 Tax=Rhizobium sp. CF142 TaxID=1144314 RepID=UPI00026EF7B0|nr:3-oxo-tetronate kinase [Rhizobium sp. CF142]EJJ30023.1 hypothetical protein PMI11_01689 [Rhizobium sp. CF142]